MPGQITASFGREYLVELESGEAIRCVSRGKRSDFACGDQVTIRRLAHGQGVIETAAARAALLYRSDAHRQKLIAANVTQIVVVLAAEPSFYEELLNRCLVAAEHQRIRVLIVLNKCDLPSSTAALAALQLYRELGYAVLPLAAKRDVAPLRPHLQGQTSVLVGQSGMGKSTIINRLLPGARAAVSDISAALDSGRHTTTHARLYHLDGDSHIIDSPGLQEFGLAHLAPPDLERGFIEFRPRLGHCKFNDCRHLGEPGCAVLAAAARGEISARRLAAYQKIVAREMPRNPKR